MPAALPFPPAFFNSRATMADIYSKTKRSKIMSSIGSSRTQPEQAVASILRSLGIRSRRNVKSLPGKPDFVISKARTIIFVHGCFWHGHANCKRSQLPETNRIFWENKITGNQRRDRRNARRLRSAGWRVLTVWQCHLRKPQSVFNKLARYLQ
jgi:DNA mismatch endonuclease, patch repair protein